MKMPRHTQRIRVCVHVVCGLLLGAFFGLVIWLKAERELNLHFGEAGMLVPILAALLGGCFGAFMAGVRPANSARTTYSFVTDGGRILGPVTREQLIGLVKIGKLTWETQVWVHVPSHILSRAFWFPAWMALDLPNNPERSQGLTESHKGGAEQPPE